MATVKPTEVKTRNFVKLTPEYRSSLIEKRLGYTKTPSPIKVGVEDVPRVQIVKPIPEAEKQEGLNSPRVKPNMYLHDADEYQRLIEEHREEKADFDAEQKQKRYEINQKRKEKAAAAAEKAKEEAKEESKEEPKSSVTGSINDSAASAAYDAEKKKEADKKAEEAKKIKSLNKLIKQNSKEAHQRIPATVLTTKEGLYIVQDPENLDTDSEFYYLDEKDAEPGKEYDLVTDYGFLKSGRRHSNTVKHVFKNKPENQTDPETFHRHDEKKEEKVAIPPENSRLTPVHLSPNIGAGVAKADIPSPGNNSGEPDKPEPEPSKKAEPKPEPPNNSSSEGAQPSPPKAEAAEKFVIPSFFDVYPALDVADPANRDKVQRIIDFINADNKRPQDQRLYYGRTNKRKDDLFYVRDKETNQRRYFTLNGEKLTFSEAAQEYHKFLNAFKPVIKAYNEKVSPKKKQNPETQLRSSSLAHTETNLGYAPPRHGVYTKLVSALNPYALYATNDDRFNNATGIVGVKEQLAGTRFSSKVQKVLDKYNIDSSNIDKVSRKVAGELFDACSTDSERDMFSKVLKHSAVKRIHKYLRSRGKEDGSVSRVSAPDNSSDVTVTSNSGDKFVIPYNEQKALFSYLEKFPFSYKYILSRFFPHSSFAKDAKKNPILEKLLNSLQNIPLLEDELFQDVQGKNIIETLLPSVWKYIKTHPGTRFFDKSDSETRENYLALAADNEKIQAARYIAIFGSRVAYPETGLASHAYLREQADAFLLRIKNLFDTYKRVHNSFHTNEEGKSVRVLKGELEQSNSSKNLIRSLLSEEAETLFGKNGYFVNSEGEFDPSLVLSFYNNPVTEPARKWFEFANDLRDSMFAGFQDIGNGFRYLVDKPTKEDAGILALNDYNNIDIVSDSNGFIQFLMNNFPNTLPSSFLEQLGFPTTSGYFQRPGITAEQDASDRAEIESKIGDDFKYVLELLGDEYADEFLPFPVLPTDYDLDESVEEDVRAKYGLPSKQEIAEKDRIFDFFDFDEWGSAGGGNPLTLKEFLDKLSKSGYQGSELSRLNSYLLEAWPAVQDRLTAKRQESSEFWEAYRDWRNDYHRPTDEASLDSVAEELEQEAEQEGIEYGFSSQYSDQELANSVSQLPIRFGTPAYVLVCPYATPESMEERKTKVIDSLSFSLLLPLCTHYAPYKERYSKYQEILKSNPDIAAAAAAYDEELANLNSSWKNTRADLEDKYDKFVFDPENSEITLTDEQKGIYDSMVNAGASEDDIVSALVKKDPSYSSLGSSNQEDIKTKRALLFTAKKRNAIPSLRDNALLDKLDQTPSQRLIQSGLLEVFSELYPLYLENPGFIDKTYIHGFLKERQNLLDFDCFKAYDEKLAYYDELYKNKPKRVYTPKTGRGHKKESPESIATSQASLNHIEAILSAVDDTLASLAKGLASKLELLGKEIKVLNGAVNGLSKQCDFFIKDCESRGYSVSYLKDKYNNDIPVVISSVPLTSKFSFRPIALDFSASDQQSITLKSCYIDDFANIYHQAKYQVFPRAENLHIVSGDFRVGDARNEGTNFADLFRNASANQYAAATAIRSFLGPQYERSITFPQLTLRQFVPSELKDSTYLDPRNGSTVAPILRPKVYNNSKGVQFVKVIDRNTNGAQVASLPYSAVKPPEGLYWRIGKYGSDPGGLNTEYRVVVSDPKTGRPVFVESEVDVDESDPDAPVYGLYTGKGVKDAEFANQYNELTGLRGEPAPSALLRIYADEKGNTFTESSPKSNIDGLDYVGASTDKYAKYPEYSRVINKDNVNDPDAVPLPRELPCYSFDIATPKGTIHFRYYLGRYGLKTPNSPQGFSLNNLSVNFPDAQVFPGTLFAVTGDGKTIWVNPDLLSPSDKSSPAGMLFKYLDEIRSNILKQFYEVQKADYTTRGDVFDEWSDVVPEDESEPVPSSGDEIPDEENDSISGELGSDNPRRSMSIVRGYRPSFIEYDLGDIHVGGNAQDVVLNLAKSVTGMSNYLLTLSNPQGKHLNPSNLPEFLSPDFAYHLIQDVAYSLYPLYGYLPPEQKIPDSYVEKYNTILSGKLPLSGNLFKDASNKIMSSCGITFEGLHVRANQYKEYCKDNYNYDLKPIDAARIAWESAIRSPFLKMARMLNSKVDLFSDSGVAGSETSSSPNSPLSSASSATDVSFNNGVPFYVGDRAEQNVGVEPASEPVSEKAPLNLKEIVDAPEKQAKITARLASELSKAYLIDKKDALESEQKSLIDEISSFGGIDYNDIGCCIRQVVEPILNEFNQFERLFPEVVDESKLPTVYEVKRRFFEISKEISDALSEDAVTLSGYINDPNYYSRQVSSILSTTYNSDNPIDNLEEQNAALKLCAKDIRVSASRAELALSVFFDRLTHKLERHLLAIDGYGMKFVDGEYVPYPEKYQQYVTADRKLGVEIGAKMLNFLRHHGLSIYSSKEDTPSLNIPWNL